MINTDYVVIIIIYKQYIPSNYYIKYCYIDY